MSVCVTSAGSATGMVYGGPGVVGPPPGGMSIAHMPLASSMMQSLQPPPPPPLHQHQIPSPLITNSISALDGHNGHVHQQQQSSLHRPPPPPPNHHHLHHQHPHSVLHPQLSPINLQLQPNQQQPQQPPSSSSGDGSDHHPNPDMLLALIARNKALEGK